MKELFPYHGEKILVTQEMCDHNGHMNTGSYTRCFDGCWGQMYIDMGFNDEYFNAGNSSFTLEENLKYFKEFLEGDYIYPSFRIVGLNRKCIHILGCLFFKSITSLKYSHDILGKIPFDLRLTVKESV